jgi:mannose-6-phosphate isomerase-like protein (cupin superfamily)
MVDTTSRRPVVVILTDTMNSRHRRRAFSVLAKSRSSQAAVMTLAPDAKSNEESANEHAWAEQWLYVVSGSGTVWIGNRTVRLRAGSLLLIERREPHVRR